MAQKESEEEFKLPLRQWLMKKIELHQFSGLEWMNEETRLFKIPWTQKGHPNWEAHYKIFIAWARHRGNYNEKDPPDDKKLKGNFRCALTKSDDFEEMKGYSKTNQQMGNYKVFKLLAPQEVKAKRERRKRPHPKSNSASSPLSSLELPQKKPNENRKTVAEPAIVDKHFDHTTTYYDNIEKPSDTLLTINSADVLDFPDLRQLDSLQPRISGNGSAHLSSTVSNQPGISQTAESPLPYYDTPVLLSPSPAVYMNNDVVEPISPAVDQPSQLQIKNFEQFLQKFNIPREQLSQFNVTVRYEREKVWEGTVDLSRGIRIMYGDPQRQKAILDAFEKRVVDIDVEAWSFPKYKGVSRQVEKILHSTDLGIVLKTDARNALYGTRICQSQVFYFEHNDEGCTSTKMERQQRIELFSYLKYVRRLIKHQRDNANANTDCETVLVIGTKPNTPHSASLVSMVLEPVLSDLLKNHFNANDSASLLAISQQTSLDELIRMLDDFDMSTL